MSQLPSPPSLFPPSGWNSQDDEGFEEQRLHLNTTSHVGYQTLSSAQGFNDAADTAPSRSWVQRVASPMHAGSLRGGILTLVVSALGAGVLALPLVVKQCGIVLGAILIGLGGCFAVWTLEALVECGRLTGLHSYSGLTREYFGRYTSTFSEVAMILYCFGGCVGYLLIVGECAMGILRSFEGVPRVFTANSDLLILTIALGFVFPLTCFRDLSKLAYFSLVSVLAIVYVLVAMCVRGAVGWNGADMISFDHVKPVVIDWTFPKSAAIVFFAYASHINLFPVYMNLENPTERRMRKVIRRSVAVEFLIYEAFGLIGYLSLGDDTRDNIVLSYDEHDVLFIVARVAVVMSLTVVCPLIFAPCHAGVDRLLFPRKAFSRIRHVAVSLFLVVSAALLAVLVPSLSVVFGLLGGTFAVLFCFYLPIMLYIRIIPTARYQRGIYLLFLALVCFLGMSSVATSIYELIV